MRRGKRRVTSGSLKCDLNLAFRTISFGRKSSTGTEAVLVISSWWEGRGRSREIASVTHRFKKVISLYNGNYPECNGRNIAYLGYGRTMLVGYGLVGPKMGANRLSGGAHGPRGRRSTFWRAFHFWEGIAPGGW